MCRATPIPTPQDDEIGQLKQTLEDAQAGADKLATEHRAAQARSEGGGGACKHTCRCPAAVSPPAPSPARSRAQEALEAQLADAQSALEAERAALATQQAGLTTQLGAKEQALAELVGEKVGGRVGQRNWVLQVGAMGACRGGGHRACHLAGA